MKGTIQIGDLLGPLCDRLGTADYDSIAQITVEPSRVTVVSFVCDRDGRVVMDNNPPEPEPLTKTEQFRVHTGRVTA